MKVAFLIPTTSKSRNFKDLKQADLMKYLLHSIRNTCTSFDYKIFIGIDQDDEFYIKYIDELSMFDITIFDSTHKGHLTRIWNTLFEKAYNQNYNYFVQCGDDIRFEKNWLEPCISALKQNNDIGISGPIDINNHKILTQTVVSRKHMEIFGYYFPTEIKNWYCDDWINKVYGYFDLVFPNGICENQGGVERYDVKHLEPTEINIIIEKSKSVLCKYGIPSRIHKKYAIIFTVYNRGYYLSETLDSWLDVNNLDLFDIYFKVEPSDKLEEILCLIEIFRTKVNTTTYIIINSERLGCAKNTFDAFELMFKNYDFCILAEDDFIVSDDVCQYFVFLENMYKNENRIASITASCSLSKNYHTDKVIKKCTFTGRIWGTWKHIWNTYMRDTWDFGYKHNGWDWNLSSEVYPKNNLYQIQPMVSRSNHIGVNGIHCDKDIFNQTTSSSFNISNKWDTLCEYVESSIHETCERYKGSNIFIDTTKISEISEEGKSGIHRVIDNIVKWLCKFPFVKLIRCYDKHIYTNKKYKEYLCNSEYSGPDESVVLCSGDILFLIEEIDYDKKCVSEFETLKQRGLTIVSVVHDVIPITHPECVKTIHHVNFKLNFKNKMKTSSSILCVSQTTKDEILKLETTTTNHIEYFHLGCDLSPSGYTNIFGMPTGRNVLMVGTIEPRKCYAKTLDVFETIWKSHPDINLIIAGRVGWLTKDLINRIFNHSHLNKNLFYLTNATDSDLVYLYKNSDLFLFSSSIEGFGLPLVEAANYGLPLVLRNTKIFKEIAGDNAMYFSDFNELLTLIPTILNKEIEVPSSKNIRMNTWEQSAIECLNLLLKCRENHLNSLNML